MIFVATIKFRMDDLSGAFGSKDLEETINKLGMGVEEIKEGEITLDITPNRPDLLDINGLARAMAQFAGKRVPKEKFYSIGNSPILNINVTKDVKSVRPYIGAVVAKNLDLKGNKLVYFINFLDKIGDTYGRKRKKIATGMLDLDNVKGDVIYDAAPDGKFKPGQF